MKKGVGLWIDHRKTIIVRISGVTDEITRIASNVEAHVQSAGAAPEIKGEDQRDRRFLDHLNKYYEKVISHVRNAEFLLILGPGEAKGELVKRLQREKLSEHIVGVETADKMTERQIAARVRQQLPAEME